MEIVPEPRMNRSEVVALHRLIKKRRPGRVLEWGGGGSTLYWPAHYPEIDWVTIEHDPEWYEGLRGKISESVTLLHLDVPDYHDIGPVAIGLFDLIIVDGRERVQCLSNARNLLAPGGVVVLHDSSRRRWRPGWAFYAEIRHLAAPEKGRRGLVLLQKPRPTKVFGLGLSRTGTVSLTAALGTLGYQVKHFPPALEVMAYAERYDALTDTPVALYVEVLDRLHPGAKFILTVRDEEGWLDSCRRHWAGRKPTTPGWRWNRRAVYGIETFDEAVFLRVYREHVERILHYFAGRPGKLLVLNVCAGEGYERLCPFLNLSVRDEAFPHRNVGETK
jgi:hypothetical protein